MTGQTQIRWLRVLVEAVTIVGSILLAFGIQAWWDQRRERQEAEVYLQQLDVELAVSVQQLEEALVWTTNSVRAIDRILPFFAEGRFPDADTTSFLADLYYPSRRFVFGALSPPSNLDLIQSQELRRLLTEHFLESGTLRGLVGILPRGYRVAVRQALPARLQLELRTGCHIIAAEPCSSVDSPGDLAFLESLRGRSALVGDLNELGAQYLMMRVNIESILERTRALRVSIAADVAR